MTTPRRTVLSLIHSCRAGQLPPFSSSPRKVENYLAPSPGCGCRELRESGIWRQPHSKESLWGCKGESAPEPGRQKGSPQPRRERARVLQTHPRLHTPISPGQGDKVPSPEFGQPPPADLDLVLRVSQDPQPPRTRGNFAPSSAPPLRALTSCWSCRGASQEQSEEQRDPAESRGGRPGRGHRGCGGRGAAGCGAGGRHGSRGWREAASEEGQVGAREGAVGRGSRWSSLGGRALSPANALAVLRRARAASEEEPASERASVERAGGGRGLGPSLCRASAGRKGGGGRAASERGRPRPRCQPPPLAAGPSALQSLTPIPLASCGLKRFLLADAHGSPALARLESVLTIFQTVRWRPRKEHSPQPASSLGLSIAQPSAEIPVSSLLRCISALSPDSPPWFQSESSQPRKSQTPGI